MTDACWTDSLGTPVQMNTALSGHPASCVAFTFETLTAPEIKQARLFITSEVLRHAVTNTPPPGASQGFDQLALNEKLGKFPTASASKRHPAGRLNLIGWVGESWRLHTFVSMCFC